MNCHGYCNNERYLKPHVAPNVMTHTYRIDFFFFLFLAGIQLTTEPELMLDQGRSQWRTILVHYAGIIAIAGVGILLAVFIPVIGFFVCCFRCAGTFTRRRKERALIIIRRIVVLAKRNPLGRPSANQTETSPPPLSIDPTFLLFSTISS